MSVLHFIDPSGQQRPVLSIDQLYDYVHDGLISDSTLVWDEECDRWVKRAINSLASRVKP